MSKIVIDARTIGESTGRYIERLLHYLQQIDRTNDYIVLLKAKDFDDFIPINNNFKKLLCPYKEFTFSEQIGFLAQLIKLKPDLVHFGMTQQPILYFGKVITTIHDLTTARFDNPAKNKIVFRIKQLVYKMVILVVAFKSKAIITPSEYVKKDIASFAKIKQNKIVVTYEGADEIKQSAEAVNSLQNKKYIMYVGRPTPHKNLERLVLAFSQLKDKFPDLRLALIGKKDFNYEQLERFVSEKGIKQVDFLGFVPDSQLRWLYEHTAGYIFPSLSEGFGLPGLEAMRHLAPVISSNATCLPEIYGASAVYFDPLDVDDMSKKIESVLNNKTLSDEMIQKGLNQIKNYSWRTMAEQTLEVYSRLLG